MYSLASWSLGSPNGYKLEYSPEELKVTPHHIISVGFKMEAGTLIQRNYIKTLTTTVKLIIIEVQ